MKIVILDGYTANPGDLGWEGLEMLGVVKAYDRTRPSETVARAADAEIVLTNKVVLGRAEIEQLPQLQYIGVLATGYNVVDLEAARERGIIVTNVPAYSTESVAQMVFAHLLTVTNRTEHYALQNRDGRWTESPDFCYWDTRLTELSGRRFGIVGLTCDILDATGRIQQDVVQDARDILESTGVEYPVLILSPELERATDLMYVPTSYFVDATGRVLEGPITGSMSGEDWKKKIEEHLAALG